MTVARRFCSVRTDDGSGVQTRMQLPPGFLGVPRKSHGFTIPCHSFWAPIQPFVLSCASELPLAGWPGATRTLRVFVQVALLVRGERIALTGS
jgi:hypothetical protein